MSNWYESIDIKTKSKKEIETVLDWINKKCIIEEDMIDVNLEKNSISIEGNESESIVLKDKKSEHPDVTKLFLSLSKYSPSINYSGYASAKNSVSDYEEEDFIEYKEGKLKIDCTEVCSKVYIGEYDDYEEFMEDYDCKISESKFEKLLEEDEEVYITDKGKVLTEEEYYKNKKNYMNFDLNSTDDFNDLSEENASDKIKLLTKEQKQDKNIALKFIEVDSSLFYEFNDKVFKDKQVSYTLLKSCSYFWDDLCIKNPEVENDKYLVEIYEQMKKINDDEQNEYRELFEQELTKEKTDNGIELISKKYKEIFNAYFNDLEKSDKFINWINN